MIKIFTSAEREVKDSRRSGLFSPKLLFLDEVGHTKSVRCRFYLAIWRSESRISSSYLWVLWFIIHLVYYSRKKSWLQKYLQKTFKQFGLVASKYERKSRYISNFQCVSLRRRVCLCPVMPRNMFLQSAFQFGFFPSKPCLALLKSSLEIVLHSRKPKFISLPVQFPADGSKFQFCKLLYYGPK